MGMGILGWQLLILITIVVAGRSRGIAVIFWVIWTLVQVAALPLSILQFGTIWLGHTIAAALFPSRPDVTSKTSTPSPQKPVQLAAKTKPATPASGDKAQAAKPSQSMPPKDLAELLRSISVDPPASEIPSVNARAKLELLARRQQDKELEDVRRQVREMYRKNPSVAGAVVKGVIRSAPVSTPAQARAPASPRPVPRGSMPPPDQDFSKSLVDHLEMLNRSSIDRTPSELPSITKSPANTRKGVCVKCAPQRSKAVSGMRYCGDCGAFVGMAH